VAIPAAAVMCPCRVLRLRHHSIRRVIALSAARRSSAPHAWAASIQQAWAKFVRAGLGARACACLRADKSLAHALGGQVRMGAGLVAGLVVSLFSWSIDDGNDFVSK